MPRPVLPLLARCLIALAVIVAFGCGKHDSPDANGPDAAARPTSTPRLAVLSPAMAIILHDLGRADTIVGRHGWDMVCDAAIPIVGDQRGVDYEVLLSVNPDAVVMEAGAEAVPARLSELAAARNWEIERLPMLTLADIRAAIIALDAMTADGETPSKAAAALLDRMDRVMRPSDELRRRAGRTLILASADPIGVMGPGSFHDQIARSLGLRVIPETGAPYIALPPEELHALNPDTIVLIAPGATESDRDAMLAPLAGLTLDALRRGRIILITDDLALTPSTAMIDFAESLAKRIGELPVVDQ